MDSTIIYLVRHGQTVWNVEKRMQGHQDSPLTKLGIMQANWAKEAFHDIKIDIIYSSPSNRAYRTAQIIRGSRDIPLIAKNNIREINLGDWEGAMIDDIQKEYPKEYNAFWQTPHMFQPKNGESYYDVQDRAIREIKGILKEHRGKTILIVTHTVTLKLIMAYFKNRTVLDLWDSPYIHPASISMVEIKGEKYIIHRHGDTSHYKENIVGW
jgi:probable phosphoglycerate mutase